MDDCYNRALLGANLVYYQTVLGLFFAYPCKKNSSGSKRALRKEVWPSRRRGFVIKPPDSKPSEDRRPKFEPPAIAAFRFLTVVVLTFNLSRVSVGEWPPRELGSITRLDEEMR